MTERDIQIEQANVVDHILFSIYEHSSFNERGIPIELYIEMHWPKLTSLMSKSLKHQGIPNLVLQDSTYATQYDRNGRLTRTFPGLDMSGISLEQTAILFPTDRSNSTYGLLCKPTPDLKLEHPLCIINGQAQELKETAQILLGGHWTQLPEATQSLETHGLSLSVEMRNDHPPSKYACLIPAPLRPQDYHDLIARLSSGVTRSRKRLENITSLVNSLRLMYPPGNLHEILFDSFPKNAYLLSDILYALQFIGNKTHIEITKTGEIIVRAIPVEQYLASEISAVTKNLEKLLGSITSQPPISEDLFRLLDVPDQHLLALVNTSIKSLKESWQKGSLNSKKNLIESLINFLKTQTESGTFPGEDRPR